jgi:hypothetical protein
MTRRRQKPPRRIQIPIQELNAIVERTRDGALPESTQTTLARVQRIVFGSPSERTAAVLGDEKTGERPPAAAGETAPVVRRQARPIRTRSARRRNAPGTVATGPRTIPARGASRSPIRA